MTTQEKESLIQFIPLNKLKKSPRNVRQVPHSKEHIAALANNIQASRQIHNLVVETECDDDGKPTGHYLVTVGEGRRLAQLLRVKRKQIKASEPIACVIDDTHDALAVSLSENDIRSNMHPADQFEAFKRLIDAGQSAEDVAAQFGVSPVVVTRRLKLANVAPEFMAMYRKDREKFGLEHLMALAITEDHERQRKAWASLPKDRRSPDALRRALTENEVPLRAAVVKFVGLKEYEKAGGAVRTDLFSDSPDDGYAVDGELLRTLAMRKLEQRADLLRKEGWSWVEVLPQADYSALSEFGRVGKVLREATEDERTELATLNAQLQQIEKQIEAAGEDEAAEALQEQAEPIEERIGEIEDGRRVVDPAQRAVAGAVVSMDYDGDWKIVTDLLRPEDAKRFARAEKAQSRSTSGAPRIHSAALVRRLTAHRTLALGATVAQQPQVALLALTRRLALLTFYGRLGGGHSDVQIDLRRTAFDQYGEDVPGSKAARTMADLEEGWSARLPEEPDALLDWLAGLPQEDVLSLCAFCVGTSLNGVTQNESQHELDGIAKAAGLDMREWWSPTADGYLKKVSRARIVEALAEAGSPVNGLTEKMKKNELAALAEQKLAGSGWLPALLRGSAA